jgi:hypothetical protein
MNVITASFFMVFHLRLPTSCAGAVLAPALLRQLRESAPFRFTCHCPHPRVSGLLLRRIGEDARLLAYSQGPISSRSYEACAINPFRVSVYWILGLLRIHTPSAFADLRVIDRLNPPSKADISRFGVLGKITDLEEFAWRIPLSGS